MPKATFEVIRTPGITADNLRDALLRFETRHGRLPHGITTGPSSEVALQLAMDRLGHDIPVHTTGGALHGEIWLQVSKPSKQAKERHDE